MSKYHNKIVRQDGFTFDSQAENVRYWELKQLEKAKVITALEVHPTFVLQEGFTFRNGTKHRAIEYEADFAYNDLERKIQVVEDVKGHRTEIYKMKKKMLLKKYPFINFVEIKP